MTEDTIITLVAAFGSAAAGALLGSLSAFYLGARKQQKDSKEESHGALLFTQYALMSQWNILVGIKKEHLDPYRNTEERFLKLPFYFVAEEHLPVSYKEITFIANSDNPNLLQMIHIAEQQYRTAIKSVHLRNEKLSQLTDSPNTTMKDFDIETGNTSIKATGKDILFLRQATDLMYETFDRAIPNIENEIRNIEEYTKKHFKKMRVLRMNKDKNNVPPARGD